jgi:hypothetical protein
MLPLELGNPGLFGDDLQFVPSCVAFLLESAGIAVRIVRVPTRRPGGVGAVRRPRGVTRHSRSCSWNRGGIPSDKLESTKEIVRLRQNLKEGCEEADDRHLRRAPARLPSASSLAGCLLPLLAMEFLEILVLEEKELELAEAWKEEDLVKG